MEYQTIVTLLEKAPNQTSKFGTRNLIEINDDLRETYNNSSQIKFKTSMLELNLCDYSDS